MEDAVKISQTKIEILKSRNYCWGWVRTLIDLGDTLVRCNESGDKERAHDPYQQSLDMFTEMGAPDYIKVLEERLGDL